MRVRAGSRIGDDAMGVVEGALFSLRKIGVQFDLVDAEGDTRLAHEFFQMRRQEVADTDGAYEPASARLDQCAQRFDIKAFAGIGPVDEVEVVIVKLRPI